MSHTKNGGVVSLILFLANVTYKVQFTGRADSGTARINRTTRDLDHSNGYDARGVSNLTVMEIAQ